MKRIAMLEGFHVASARPRCASGAQVGIVAPVRGCSCTGSRWRCAAHNAGRMGVADRAAKARARRLERCCQTLLWAGDSGALDRCGRLGLVGVQRDTRGGPGGGWRSQLLAPLQLFKQRASPLMSRTRIAARGAAVFPALIMLTPPLLASPEQSPVPQSSHRRIAALPGERPVFKLTRRTNHHSTGVAQPQPGAPALQRGALRGAPR